MDLSQWLSDIPIICLYYAGQWPLTLMADDEDIDWKTPLGNIIRGRGPSGHGRAFLYRGAGRYPMISYFTISLSKTPLTVSIVIIGLELLSTMPLLHSACEPCRHWDGAVTGSSWRRQRGGAGMRQSGAAILFRVDVRIDESVSDFASHDNAWCWTLVWYEWGWKGSGSTVT